MNTAPEVPPQIVHRLSADAPEAPSQTVHCYVHIVPHRPLDSVEAPLVIPALPDPGILHPTHVTHIRAEIRGLRYRAESLGVTDIRTELRAEPGVAWTRALVALCMVPAERHGLGTQYNATCPLDIAMGTLYIAKWALNIAVQALRVVMGILYIAMGTLDTARRPLSVTMGYRNGGRGER